MQIHHTLSPHMCPLSVAMRCCIFNSIQFSFFLFPSHRRTIPFHKSTHAYVACVSVWWIRSVEVFDVHVCTWSNNARYTRYTEKERERERDCDSVVVSTASCSLFSMLFLMFVIRETIIPVRAYARRTHIHTRCHYAQQQCTATTI